MMKSRMPSVWRSIFEHCVSLGRAVVLVRVGAVDRYRGGFHQLAPPAVLDAGADRLDRAAGRLDVLDRHVGDLVDLLDQAVLEPLRLLAGEGRDQDLVDPVVLDRVLDRGERLGAHRLAGGVDLVAVELGEGGREPVADLLARSVAGARADEGVAVRALRVALASAARPGRER